MWKNRQLLSTCCVVNVSSINRNGLDSTSSHLYYSLFLASIMLLSLKVINFWCYSPRKHCVVLNAIHAFDELILSLLYGFPHQRTTTSLMKNKFIKFKSVDKICALEEKLIRGQSLKHEWKNRYLQVKATMILVYMGFLFNSYKKQLQ